MGIDALLDLREIFKSFGKIQVLNNVSLSVYSGEVLALSGENGAGKSTLMKIVAGLYPPSRGQVILDGEPYTNFNLSYSRKRGVSLIYQELSIAPNINVMENIFMGSEQNRLGILSRQEMYARSSAILKQLSANFDVYTKAGNLSIAQQQMIEIARALSHNSKLIIMDEPTASLSKREVLTLFELIAQLKSQGITIVYISHKMDEIQQIAERVAILRDGEYIGDAGVNETDRIIYMMVGRSLESFYKSEDAPRVKEAVKPFSLELNNLSDKHGMVKDVSCNLMSGRVVGLFGLVGAGRSELARLIFGADKKAYGEVRLAGRKLSVKSPIDAIRQGIAMVPEDRKLQGLFLDMSSLENIVENKQQDNAFVRFFINRIKNKIMAIKSIKDLNIKTTLEKHPRDLSGGNQQKLLLARWLNIWPKVLILDEPTRGVDVGAKQEIYKIIKRMACENTLVLLISSELPEIINLADQLLIMKDGQLAGHITQKSEFSQEHIMRLCV